MKRHARAFWIGLVAEVRGGAAVADVAKRHRVNEGTLRWWRTQLRSTATNDGPRLVPVVSPEHIAVPPCLVEVAISGIVLRVQVGADVTYVAELARALSRTC